MPSGKSSERLAEEIGAVVYGSEPLYNMNPIDIFKHYQQRRVPPDIDSICVPLPPSTYIFNGWLTALNQHVQVQTNVDLSEDSVEHDWHVIDKNTLNCIITGATVSVQQFSTEIPVSIKDTFETREFQKRLANVSESRRDLVPSWTAAYPSCAWELMARIVRDLLTTKPENRQSIGSSSAKASALLDLHEVLPYLGFYWDQVENRFQPPRESGEQFEARLRRILVEVMLEVNQSELKRPLVPLLAQFLGSKRSILDADGSYTLPDNILSPPSFGCLGAVQWFSDDRIFERYQQACTNDPTGGPWYLEALKQISEQNHSEILETRFIELISLGTPTLSMIQDGLAKLGLDLDTQLSLTDDQLLDITLDVSTDALSAIISALNSLRPSSVVLQRAQSAIKLDESSSLRIFSLNDESQDLEIAERFKALWDSTEPINQLEARSALECLAFARRSAKLLALYETVEPPRVANEHLTLENSYALMGLPTHTKNHDFSDQDIEAIFEANCEELQPSALLELRRALKVIAIARESSELLQYLGYSDTSDELNDSTSDFNDKLSKNRIPVGLWNTGNTCYLNSLLQFYYSLPAVREYVKSFEEKESKAEQEVEALNRINGDNNIIENDEEQNSEVGENLNIDNSNTINDQQPKLDSDYCSKEPDTDKMVPPVYEKDKEVVCSQNDVEKNKIGETNDMASNCPNFSQVQRQHKKIAGHIVTPKEIRRSEIFVSRLGKLFKQIGLTKSAHVTPSEMLAYMALIPPQEDADDICALSGPNEEYTLRGRLAGALQRQQDVTECIENVLYQLEATMPATALDEDGEQHDLVKDLFYGTTIQTLKRQDGSNKRTKTESFSSLLLDVNDGPTFIYDSLDKYFDDELLDLEDGKTIRTLRIKSLPQILQIQVQRVQFDTQTFMPYKNINPLIFPETVYMDRYLDCEKGSALHMRTQKVKFLKSECSSIQDRLNPHGKLIKQRDALETVSCWLKDTNEQVSDNTKEVVTNLYLSLTNEFAQLQANKEYKEAEISHEFDDLTEHGYRIHSLFIHKGDVSYGHYWIYIRDQETNQFYKYNDEIVTAVSDNEVFDFREQNLATPYFLVFVKNTATDTNNS